MASTEVGLAPTAQLSGGGVEEIAVLVELLSWRWPDEAAAATAVSGNAGAETAGQHATSSSTSRSGAWRGPTPEEHLAQHCLDNEVGARWRGWS